MKKRHDMPASGPGKRDAMRREFAYLRRLSEQSAAKILRLDLQCMGIRHELEQKRRGFQLIADLTFTLGQDTDYQSTVISVCRRLNTALNMQRTAILVPSENGMYRTLVLHGYPAGQDDAMAAKRISLDEELRELRNPLLVTGADPKERLAAFRQALALPFFIAVPFVLQTKVTALLVTGRVQEHMPWQIRLGRHDVENVQAVSSYLTALLAMRRLVEEEERTQIMLDATPLCCNFWDTGYRNIDCNQEAARLFDLSSKQEYLDRFDELSPQRQPNGRISSEMAREKIQEALATGYARFDWMHQKLNGEPIPSEITLIRVRHGTQDIVASYTRDLRELKAMLAEMRKAEDALRLARDQAESNARAKSEFLANMSHEIRTPMNAILGMTHLLAGTEMTDKQRLYVEKAEHSANLLLHIINDILDFSKIDAGRLEMERIRFSPRKLARNVYDIMISQVNARALALHVTVAPDVPDAVLGDPLRLEQVVLNLMSNAVKFTTTGSVTIRVTKDADLPGKTRLLVEVTDTGIGMTAEQLAGLFTPFTQADASTTRKYGGTGLGLAISKSLVSMMDGEIWCASLPGAGSTFSFTVVLELPTEAGAPADDPGEATAARDADALFAASGTPEAFPELRGMRVLLAEDNDINQLIAQELLTGKGVDVDVVSTGREALDALAAQAYDLVLMDIQMPEMDGLAATAHIRSNPDYRDLPIIAMTAHAMLGDRELSLSSGMNDHLTKPIDPHLLYMALKRWGRK